MTLSKRRVKEFENAVSASTADALINAEAITINSAQAAVRLCLVFPGSCASLPMQLGGGQQPAALSRTPPCPSAEAHCTQISSTVDLSRLHHQVVRLRAPSTSSRKPVHVPRPWSQVAEHFDVQLLGYRDAAVHFERTTARIQTGQATIIGCGLTVVLAAHAATCTPSVAAAADLVSFSQGHGHLRASVLGFSTW